MPAVKTNPIPAIMTSLATFYQRGRRSERICYVLAAVLFASGLFHLAVFAVAGGPWTGPVSWRKPFYLRAVVRAHPAHDHLGRLIPPPERS